MGFYLPKLRIFIKTKIMNTDKSELQKINELDAQVVSVIGSDQMQGFQKAFAVSEAIGNLKKLLTSDYMRPIMELQGNRLGFKTDKDKHGGYSEEVVKNCLIEAVLMGVQPVGNQFNIIAGNTYITKEGFGYLLSRVQSLSYQIKPQLPRVKDTSAAIVMEITWNYDGGTKRENVEIPIKVNSMMGTDAIIGKATRKARAWLYNNLTGAEIADGDVVDLDSKKMLSNNLNAKQTAEEKERERIQQYVDACTIDDLDLLQESQPDNAMIQEIVKAKRESLKSEK